MSRSDSKSDEAGPIYRHGPESNRPIRFVGDLFTIKARETDTNGAYSLTEMLVSANAPGPPPHHHPDCEEAFYVISGELAFEINGQPVSAPAGTFVVVPRGAEHVYNNPRDEPSRVLVVISPPGFEHQFEVIGEPTSSE